MYFGGGTFFTTQIHFTLNTLPPLASSWSIFRILTSLYVILNRAAFALTSLAAYLRQASSSLSEGHYADTRLLSSFRMLAFSTAVFVSFELSLSVATLVRSSLILLFKVAHLNKIDNNLLYQPIH